MNKQKIINYMKEHPNANKSSLQAIGIDNLKSKILNEYNVSLRVTQNMSKNSLVNLYRNLYVNGLKVIKYDK